MDIINKIWDCGQDLIGYANELEQIGRKGSAESLREIVNQIENLIHNMNEHPRK